MSNICINVIGYDANDRSRVGGQFQTKTTYSELLKILKQCDPEIVYAKIEIETM